MTAKLVCPQGIFNMVKEAIAVKDQRRHCHAVNYVITWLMDNQIRLEVGDEVVVPHPFDGEPLTWIKREGGFSQ